MNKLTSVSITFLICIIVILSTILIIIFNKNYTSIQFTIVNTYQKIIDTTRVRDWNKDLVEQSIANDCFTLEESGSNKNEYISLLSTYFPKKVSIQKINTMTIKKDLRSNTCIVVFFLEEDNDGIGLFIYKTKLGFIRQIRISNYKYPIETL